MRIPLSVGGMEIAEVNIEIIPKQTLSGEPVSVVGFYQALPFLREKIHASVNFQESDLKPEQLAALKTIGYKTYEERRAEEAAQYTTKSFYLKNEKTREVLGLHATVFKDSPSDQLEAWANAYDDKFKYKGSVFRIFGPIEETRDDILKDGWILVEPPPEGPTYP